MIPTLRLSRLLPLPLVGAALALAACGEKSEPSTTAEPPAPQRVTLAVGRDTTPAPAQAGLYAARDAGDFERAGLTLAPLPDRAPLTLLASGKADLALASAPELLEARRGVGGAELVSVGALVQRPLIGAVTTLAANRVRTLADLRGKRVGVPRRAAPLQGALIAAAGVRALRTLDEPALLEALAKRKLDAAIGVRTDIAQARVAKPRLRTLPTAQADLPPYPEIVLVARRKALDTDGAARVRRFLQAVSQGQRRVRADPDAAVNALRRADRTLDASATRRAVEQVAPLLLPADDEHPFGYQRRSEWVALGRALARQRGGVGGGDEAAGALTNEFLPGEGFRRDSEVDGAPGLAPGER